LRNKKIKLNRRKFMGSMAGLGAAAAMPRKTYAQTIPFAKVEASKPNDLNMIVIISDTFRWDYLHCNGYNDRIITPNLDDLAEEGVYFTNTYADSLPSIPARRVMHTGNSIITQDPKWGPLLPEDITIAQILRKTDSITSGLISDFVFYYAGTYGTTPVFSFSQGFNGFQYIRGQVHDSYITGPRSSIDTKGHIPEHLMTPPLRERLFQYMLDTKDRKGTEDYFGPKIARTTTKWLEDNKDNDGPFFLWIDMFDPHEPWDPPAEYTKMYRKDFNGDRYLIDHQEKTEAMTDYDVSMFKDLYSGEVTLVDHTVGRIVNDVKRLGLWDNTIIVFSADHGTHLGEMGCVMKKSKLCNSLGTRIPMIIRHPQDSRKRGNRVDAITSHQDFTPTFLSMLGVETNLKFDGQNMWDLVSGNKTKLRDYVITNWGGHASICNHDWYYFQNIANENAGFGPQLYNRKTDYLEEKNVAQDNPRVVADLRQKLLKAHLYNV